MAKTQVPSGYIEDDAITSAKIADNTIQVGHLHSSHGITTNNIGEHTNNKYYTDARVDTRLAASKSSNFVTTGNIQISSDTGILKLGAGDDLEIKHDGGHSYVQNTVGHLYIKNFADDKDIVFLSDDGSGGTSIYFRLDGSAATGGVYYTYWGDNSRIALGDSKDLRLFHNGTNSVIQNATDADLIIQNDFVDKDVIIKSDNGAGGLTTYFMADGSTGQTQLFHYGTLKFHTTSAGAEVEGNLNITGTSSTSGLATVGNIDIPANGTNDTRIEIGTGSSSNHNAFIDLRGDATYTDYGLRLIRFNTGANANSQLVHRGTGTLFVEAADAASVILKTNGTDAVTVDSSQNVTIAGNLTVSGSQTTLNTATLDVEDKNITLNKGSGDTSSTADGAGITIQDAVSASTDASLTWRASDDKFIFSHPLRMFGQFELPDNVKMVAGDGNDLQIYHSGTDSFIDESGTGKLFIRSNEIRLNKYTGEFMIRAIADGAVTLYHDNSAKLATTSTGVAVTGNIAAESGHIEAGNTSTAKHVRAYLDDGSYMTLQGYGLEMNRGASYIRPTTDGNKTLYVGGADASLDWESVRFRTINGLYMTGTRFLDASRNLSNIGTINSGAITSTGIVTGTQLKSATSSTSAAVLKLEDTGVATYDFSFPDTSTILLGVNDQSGTTSNKVLKLLNAGSGTLGLNVEGAATFNSTVTATGGTLTGTLNGVAANFSSTVRVSGWLTGASATNTLFSGNSQGTIIQTPSNTNNAAGSFYIRDSLGTVHFTLNTNTNVSSFHGGTISSGAITSSVGNTNVGLSISGTNSTYTSAAIKNTGSGDAILWFDASNGDLAGSDYASIRQNNSLEIVIRTEASAAGISLQTQGAQRFRVSSGGTLERGSSNTATLTQAGALTVATGTFTGNVQHTGLTMTSGTDIDQLITATDSLTLSDAWQDTSIAGSDLASGTYIVQVYVNDNGVGGGHYQEFYSGVMSWTGNATNSNEVDEIILHRAGHAPNAGDIYLRTERRYQSGDVGTLMLQIRGSTSNSGASNYIFKFRRMI